MIIISKLKLITVSPNYFQVGNIVVNIEARARRSILKRDGAGSGIRTHDTLQYNGFQDRRIRPLCHPSWPFAQTGRSQSAPPVGSL